MVAKCPGVPDLQLARQWASARYDGRAGGRSPSSSDGEETRVRRIRMTLPARIDRRGIRLRSTDGLELWARKWTGRFRRSRHLWVLIHTYRRERRPSQILVRIVDGPRASPHSVQNREPPCCGRALALPSLGLVVALQTGYDTDLHRMAQITALGYVTVSEDGAGVGA